MFVFALGVYLPFQSIFILRNIEVMHDIYHPPAEGRKFITGNKWTQPYCYHWNNICLCGGNFGPIFYFFPTSVRLNWEPYFFFYIIMLNILSNWKSVTFYKWPYNINSNMYSFGPLKPAFSIKTDCRCSKLKLPYCCYFVQCSITDPY